jgi:hypothetical protein
MKWSQEVPYHKTTGPEDDQDMFKLIQGSRELMKSPLAS